jgi:hypothetical protein
MYAKSGNGIIGPGSEVAAQKLNVALLDKFEIGLDMFAYILGRVVNGEGPDIDYSAPHKNDLVEMKSELEKLKERITKVILNFESKMLWEKGRKRYFKENKEAISKVIADEYNITPFFDKLDGLIRIIDQEASTKKRGTYIRPQNLVSALWYFSIEHKEAEGKWEDIASLFEWFWNKLKGYELYKKLCSQESSIDSEYFKNQFYRNRDKKKELFRRIREKSGIGWPSLKFTSFLGAHSFAIFPYSSYNSIDIKALVDHDKQQIYEGILSNKIDVSSFSLPTIYMAYFYYAWGLNKNLACPPKVIFPDLTWI